MFRKVLISLVLFALLALVLTILIIKLIVAVVGLLMNTTVLVGLALALIAMIYIRRGNRAYVQARN